MDQKTDRIYPSAPFEKVNIDLQQRLEKKINIVNSFNNHINNITEMINYFKDKNKKKSKKKYIKYKTINTLFKSFDIFGIIATTSSSDTLSVAGIGLIVIPISTAIACALPIGNKLIYEVIINKYNKYKKLYEKYQQTIKSFNKLCRKSLQNIIIDKIEYESSCNVFTKYVDEIKNESFYKYEHENKIKLF